MTLNLDECVGIGVYVIRCQNLHKIGKTRNLRKRLSSLQVATPFDITVDIWLHRGSERLATSLEEKLHRKFSAKRVGGEWFELSEGDLQYIQKLNFIPHPTKINLDEIDRIKTEQILASPKPFHPDWYYWNWSLAYEHWHVSKEKEAQNFNFDNNRRRK